MMDGLYFLGAIFDFDGVFVNTVPLHFKAWKRMFNEFGHEFSFPDYLEKVDGISRVAGAKAILGDVPDDILREACDKKQAYFKEFLAEEGAQLYPDAVNLMKELRKHGVKIALISSSKNVTDVLSSAQQNAEELEPFDATVFGGEVENPKPAPDIYLAAARRLGLNPSSCIVFEDAKLGVESAKNAGMFCIGIDRHGKQETLKNADMVTQSLFRVTYAALINLWTKESPGVGNSLISSLTADEEWLIEEQGGTNLKDQRTWESIFALGNGHVGQRGILEEAPKGYSPGTFVAGLFNQANALVTQMVNIPNPVHLQVLLGEKKLDIRNGYGEHSRALNMRDGVLVRRTVFSDKKAGRIEYSSLRFLSMADKDIGAIQIFLTPLDNNVTITIKSRIDGSVENRDFAQKIDVRHFDVVDLGVSDEDGICYLVAETTDNKIPIGVASHLDFSCDDGSQILETVYRVKKSRMTREVKVRLKKGQQICVTKVFAIQHFPARYRTSDAKREVARRDIAIRKALFQSVRDALSKGFDRLLLEHIASWQGKWQDSDVKIVGDPIAQRALRFNIYQMLICGNKENPHSSIGAKSLTGEHYLGHVFWETELYILPFFVYANPAIAKNLLMYRYLGLDAARTNAAQRGFEGALFPWEAAENGEETTPPFFRGRKGRLIKVYTGDQGHHITSDVAYATVNYWRATDDDDFMADYGLEILLETARFWKSRVTFSKKLDRYEIRNVIGPDEFHENVHNNAFTNVMAQWNLRCASELYRKFKERFPERTQRIEERIGLKAHELAGWTEVAGKIYIPRRSPLMEAHDNYFGKRDVLFPPETTQFPIFPRDMPDNIGGPRKTQLVKQAEVVFLLYLLSRQFTEEEKKVNFDYYEPRTLHQSSLSAAIYAIVANNLGYRDIAYTYFMHAALLDLKNIHKNTGHGIHIGACGGTWQAAINGFAGVSVEDGNLNINPSLPDHWESMSFKIKWHGQNMRVTLSKNPEGGKDLVNIELLS